MRRWLSPCSSRVTARRCGLPGGLRARAAQSSGGAAAPRGGLLDGHGLGRGPGAPRPGRSTDRALRLRLRLAPLPIPRCRSTASASTSAWSTTGQNATSQRVPIDGCSIYSVPAAGRSRRRRSSPPRTGYTAGLPAGYVRPPVKPCHLAPQELPGGRLAFTSTLWAQEPPKTDLNMPSMQLFVRQPSGEIEPIAPMTIGSALHPILLTTRRADVLLARVAGAPRLSGCGRCGRSTRTVVSGRRS